MPCKSARLDLLAYVHGELDAAQSAEVKAHLADCPLCAGEVALLRGEAERMQHLMALPLPIGLEAACLRSLARESSRHGLGTSLLPAGFRPLRAFVLAAASLALAITGLSIISPPAYAMVVSGVARFGSQVTGLASQHIPACNTFIRILAGLKAAAGF